MNAGVRSIQRTRPGQPGVRSPPPACLIAGPLKLDDELVGSVAGGTSSNLMIYMARGNVALSVSMTALSTLISVVMTPLLLTLLVGSRIEIPAADLLHTLVGIIVLPVVVWPRRLH